MRSVSFIVFHTGGLVCVRKQQKPSLAGTKDHLFDDDRVHRRSARFMIFDASVAGSPTAWGVPRPPAPPGRRHGLRLSTTARLVAARSAQSRGGPHGVRGRDERLIPRPNRTPPHIPQNTRGVALDLLGADLSDRGRTFDPPPHLFGAGVRAPAPRPPVRALGIGRAAGWRKGPRGSGWHGGQRRRTGLRGRWPRWGP